MAASKRQESRERITAELLAAARAQLAEVGPAGLSLRSVAREIGMVSSAVYRYVESRDDLLTRLIIEAYDELGATAEQAASQHAEAPDIERWVATAHAIRRWCVEHPHQYLLLYGSPVPGYAAPEETVVPGTRVTFALVGVVADAHAAGRLAHPGDAAASVTSSDLSAELAHLAELTNSDLPADGVLGFLVAWTQMFGLIGFEITNQTRNMVTDHASLFDATVRLQALQMGLR